MYPLNLLLWANTFSHFYLTPIHPRKVSSHWYPCAVKGFLISGYYSIGRWQVWPFWLWVSIQPETQQQSPGVTSRPGSGSHRWCGKHRDSPWGRQLSIQSRYSRSLVDADLFNCKTFKFYRFFYTIKTVKRLKSKPQDALEGVVLSVSGLRNGCHKQLTS